jgi:hypothetical protein
MWGTPNVLAKKLPKTKSSILAEPADGTEELRDADPRTLAVDAPPTPKIYGRTKKHDISEPKNMMHNEKVGVVDVELN